MKKIILLITAFSIILVSNLFASDPVIVDTTGLDFQNYWYTGTFGQQIVVDDSGKVHVCYNKTWCTESDTGYQVMYANVTDGNKIPVPSQQTYQDIQPGVVYMDGGHNEAPIYFYYGVGYCLIYGWNFTMHFQALAKLNYEDNQILPLGLQDDMDGYSDMFWLANPIEVKVDNVNGIAHCINTDCSGWDVIYWNFDGTNFSDRYFMLNACDQHPGKTVPSTFIRNGTKGADLAVSNDGQEVTIATLHTACNILLHKGYSQGDVWEDDFFDGLANGSVIALFDTTNSATGDNIPNNDPKPYTEVQISYDEENNLHVVYDAVYKDVYLDTSLSVPWIKYYVQRSSIAGDTNGVFYDGTSHPKPQLRYWNSVTKIHSLLAECDYPKTGEVYKWYYYGILDSGRAEWGKSSNDGPIANFDFLINKNRQQGEPLMVCVWEEMQGSVIELIYKSPSPNYGSYYAYMKDLKISVSNNGTHWSNPYNITNSSDKDEGEVSVYRDVIDNKIHLVYCEDNLPGSDLNLKLTENYYDYYLQDSGMINGKYRKPSIEQVKIIYREFDLSEIPVNIESEKYIPGKFDLAQNYPNPFNNRTTIRYQLSKAGHAELSIYNVLSQKIKTLVDEVIQMGSYKVWWDGTNDAGHPVATGIYIYNLKTETDVITKKLLLLK